MKDASMHLCAWLDRHSLSHYTGNLVRFETLGDLWEAGERTDLRAELKGLGILPGSVSKIVTRLKASESICYQGGSEEDLKTCFEDEVHNTPHPGRPWETFAKPPSISCSALH